MKRLSTRPATQHTRSRTRECSHALIDGILLSCGLPCDSEARSNADSMGKEVEVGPTEGCYSQLSRQSTMCFFDNWPLGIYVSSLKRFFSIIFELTNEPL